MVIVGVGTMYGKVLQYNKKIEYDHIKNSLLQRRGHPPVL